MLRWTVPLIAVAAFVGTSAFAAESPAPAKENPVPAKDSPAPAKESPVPPKRKVSNAARQLPPGLPRPHYKYRTTVAPPVVYKAPVVIDADPDALITPAYGPGSYIDNLPGTPLLPGSTTIPGYYGRAFSYDYQGPYYGGPYTSYYWRLPYACGVYGYC